MNLTCKITSSENVVVTLVSASPIIVSSVAKALTIASVPPFLKILYTGALKR